MHELNRLDLSQDALETKIKDMLIVEKKSNMETVNNSVRYLPHLIMKLKFHPEHGA